MPLNREQLCGLIPHAGSMCLLNSVEEWDDDHIVCTAVSHHDADNPLRKNTRVPAVCGIEYGAQAMAVHGGLLAGEDEPAVGFLASVRNVDLKISSLDECGKLLRVTARKLLSNETNQMYEFEISDDDKLVISGRAAVFLQKGIAAV